MKTFFRIIPKLAVLVTLSAITGFLLLILVYLLPTAPMEENVTASVEIFRREGTYPVTDIMGVDTRLDNFTDALMLLSASYPGEENALELIGLPVSLRRALLPPGAAQKGTEALVKIDGTVNVVDAFARGFQPLRTGRHELGAQRERLRADDCLRAHLRDQHNDPHGNGEQ